MSPIRGKLIVVPLLIFIGVVVLIAAWYLFYGPGSPSHHMGQPQP